jgi:hypothetical protein
MRSTAEVGPAYPFATGLQPKRAAARVACGRGKAPLGQATVEGERKG